MASVEEAQEILRALRLPPPQHNRMAGLTLLALCGLKADAPWSQARRARCTVTKGVMDFIREQHGVRYAPNTRETFRRQVLHHFLLQGLADLNPFDRTLPTNSPNAHYALTPSALRAARAFGSEEWDQAVSTFHRDRKPLSEQRSRERASLRVPVRLPSGKELSLSPGKHNEVQRAVIEQFAPRFAPGALLLYLGDTENKNLWVDEDGLKTAGILITPHDKLPDVIFHDVERGWLLFVEAVTSHGPMTPKRLIELTELAKDATPGLIFVTAFPNAAEFRRHIDDIAWETEAWIADTPDHVIHFNGDRFLGPRD